ncbi:MAG TPA: DUF4383 domain-containing protein [Acidimicrobiales bacterium]|nr:DUF4383 domain-containing protein [Acidimicrobiales bacterium]
MSYEYKGQTQGKTQAAAPAQRAPRRSPAGGDSAAGGGSAAGGRSLLQIFSAVVGLAFLLAGVGGFIPGITSNYDDLSLFGTDSNAELLGLFRVSILHNIVHLLFAIGLLAAAKASLSKLYLIGGGVGYLGVFAYGLIVDQDSDANFLPLNDADNFLHLGLSLGMIVLGVVGVAVAKRAVSRA